MGPAIAWQDSWAIWAWHGVRVPERVISGKYNAQDALGESNAEVKRAMIERMGAERFFGELRATKIHEDVDGHGNPRRLLEIPVAGFRSGKVRAVQVTCPSTGRVYYLGVPAECVTAQQAVAWTFGIKDTEYRPLIEA